MDKDSPMTIFYDASCKLCSAEIEAIKLHDSERQFIMVDCSAATFNDALYQDDGITQKAMMNYLHVQNCSGEWFIGVDAFELIYRTLGLSAAAWLWGSKVTRPVTSRLYPWIAKHRELISWSGLPYLFQLWGKCAARKAHKRSRRCVDGKCTL